VFDNGMLSRINRHKRDEVTAEWRKLHNGKLNNLYYSLNIIRVIKSRRMKWTVYVARIRVMRSVNMFFVKTLQGKIAIGRSRCRWDTNIVMNLK
jgi:hypothetical protein